MKESWNEYSFFFILESLHVKYTKRNARRVFTENSLHNDLYGVSSMLNAYNIESTAVEIDNKLENIYLLPSSFIAVCQSGFFYVMNVTKDIVFLYLDKKHVKVPLNSFVATWTGVALLFEPNATSIEDKYKTNRRYEIMSIVLKSFFCFFIVAIVSYLIVRNNIEYSKIAVFSFLSNVFGVYVSILLLLKQMKISNDIGNKVCNLLENMDCDIVLAAPAGKFLGFFSWSEIGLAYFLSNFILILFSPESIPVLAIFAVCSLPFTIWSLWYQKYILKHWCLLCLVIQVLLWVIFIINITLSVIDFKEIVSFQFLFIGSVYVVFLFLINFIARNIEELYQSKQDILLFNAMKKSEVVFLELIKQQRYISIDRDISSIVLGEKKSENTLVVIANPLCKPCGSLHKEVLKLLETSENKICIQYIFISSVENDRYAKLLIALCQKTMTAGERLQILSSWYSGTLSIENAMHEFEKGFNECVMSEFRLHENWAVKNDLLSTPMLLFNGYMLPIYYTVPDLKYLLI